MDDEHDGDVGVVGGSDDIMDDSFLGWYKTCNVSGLPA
jgi:hypothetical protein